MPNNILFYDCILGNVDTMLRTRTQLNFVNLLNTIIMSKKYLESKLNQFKELCATEHAKTKGIKSALTAAGYGVTNEGSTMTCVKGATTIKYDYSKMSGLSITQKRMIHA